MSWSSAIPKVSIVVIFNQPNQYMQECVEKCLQIDYENFDIYLMSNTTYDYPHEKVKVIITEDRSPAKKRNLAITAADGDIIAFIDDDAYPAKDWLKNAVKYFADPGVAAVCGPGITSPDDNLQQKISGFIYESFLISGGYTYRHVPSEARFVDDYPTFNLIVRKSALVKIGGFKNDFWPGEDTLLCLDIVKQLKMKILYSPDVLVYHHRRAIFKKHLKQVANYAIHRGYFAKRFPENSKKIPYFIPSFFVLGLFFGVGLAFTYPVFKHIYVFCLNVYFAIIGLTAIKKYNSSTFLCLGFIFGVVATHITYGIFFLKGLFSRKLREE